MNSVVRVCVCLCTSLDEEAEELLMYPAAFFFRFVVLCVLLVTWPVPVFRISLRGRLQLYRAPIGHVMVAVQRTHRPRVECSGSAQ